MPWSSYCPPVTANITIELINDHYGVPLSDGTHTQSIFFSHLILVGSIIDMFFFAAGKKIILGCSVWT